MMAFVKNSAINRDFPVRAELLCAMGIIFDRMGLAWSQKHLVFPVSRPWLILIVAEWRMRVY